MPRPQVSLVIPIYNEEAVLPRLDERLQELLTKLGTDCEVVFVDDGSKDRSLEMLRTMVHREPRYRAVSFSRNFGHQRAITCGMDASRGKAVVVMDADLQDPPEVIIEMLAKWREGFDVVYGKRRSREGESWFKLFTAKMFYRLFAAMIPIEVPLDAGDFRLMSRRVVVTMRELRETHRFVRGLVAWVGFKQTAVVYDRAARAAGETKYPLRKMIAFAFDGIMSFSVLPLRMATYLGALVGAASVLYGLSAVFAHFVLHATQPGWTTTVVLVSFLFSVQLLVTGVLGEYVGRIYEQVKLRPLYIVGERVRHKAMRRRLSTQDFGSIGEAMPVTHRPAVGAPPPALGSAPAPVPVASKPPPPLPSAAKNRKP
jgi:polyisoprenyl-phosphate glycosyltransferase